MKLSIKENSLNYTCTVVEIEHLYKIEGADRIQRCSIFNNDIVCSKDVKIGDKMLYFVSGTRLNEDYCKFNNLLDKAELNNNPLVKGFISYKQLRCKAIKLKGIISNGMLMPIDSLFCITRTISEDLKVGDEFTDINDISICEKYVVEEKININGSNKPKQVNKLKDLMIDGQFKFHHQTEHLSKNLNKIERGDDIVITSKVHGSSVILSLVKVVKQLSWKAKIAKWFGVEIVTSEYKGIWSSGKPKSNLPKGIESNYQNPNKDFYQEDIWKIAYNDFKYAIEPGISLYGELIGSHIQKNYDYTKLHNSKNYGFVVYRITRTNDVGNTDEFSWNQIEEYCSKYNLQTVPVLYKGLIDNWHIRVGINPKFVSDMEDFLRYAGTEYLERDCPYSTNKVADEGVCIRKEKPYEVFKLKSKKFLLHENQAQEAGETNIEDHE